LFTFQYVTAVQPDASRRGCVYILVQLWRWNIFSDAKHRISQSGTTLNVSFICGHNKLRANNDSASVSVYVIYNINCWRSVSYCNRFAVVVELFF